MIYCQTIEESPMFRKVYVVENIKHETRCTNRKQKAVILCVSLTEESGYVCTCTVLASFCLVFLVYDATDGACIAHL